MSILRTAVFSASLGAAAAVGTNALSTPTKAELFKPLEVNDHMDYVAVHPHGPCTFDADGGIIGVASKVSDAGVPLRCWETHTRICPESQVAGLKADCEEDRTPSDADLIPTVRDTMLKGRVLPSFCERKGYACAP